ncbi:MAG: aspartate/glutamate racemase family protein [Alphaproteobacteria bacterium]
MTRPTLGIQMLDVGPIHLPGSYHSPATFPYPVLHRSVPGARVDVVTGGNRDILGAYIESARRMEREGCRAIATSCGYTSHFQAQISAAVSVPVATSSLLLVPLVERLLPPGSKIALLTFDATRFNESLASGAGWSLKTSPVIVAGVEGTESWDEMRKPQPGITHAMLARDVMAAARRVLDAHADVRAIVFECAVFPIVTNHVRAATGLPVFDYVSLANILAESVTGSAEAVRPAAAE